MAQGFLQFADLRQHDIQSLTAMGGEVGGYPTQYTVPSQAPEYQIPLAGAAPAVDPMAGANPVAPPMPSAPYEGLIAPAPSAVGGNFQTPPDVTMGYNQPVSDRPTSITGRIYGGLLKRGMPAHIAAGFMANAKDESSFDLNAIGDNGNAKGLLQWNGPRKRQFEEMFGNDWSMDNQLDFLMHELQTSEKGAWEKIQQTRTPGEAAAAIVNFFERPAESHRARREAKYLGGEIGDWAMGEDVPSEGADAAGGDVDQYEAMYGAKDPEQEKALSRGSMFLALSQGLSQMSHGEPVDLSRIMYMVQARQDAAREAMKEAYAEKTRKGERQEDISREDAAAATAAATRAAEREADRQQAFDLLDAQHANRVGEIGAEAASKFMVSAADRERNLGVAQQMLKSPNPDIVKAGQAVLDTNGDLSPADASKEFIPNSPLVSFGDKKDELVYKRSGDRIDKERELFGEKRAAIQSMEQVWDTAERFNWEIPTGPIPEAMVGASKWLGNLGFLDETGQQILSAQEAIKKGNFNMIPLSKTEGQVSQPETQWFMAAQPGLGDSPLGFRMAMQIGMGNAKAEEQRLDMEDAYLNEHGSLDNFSAYYKEQINLGNTPTQLPKLDDLFDNTTKTTNLINNGYLKPGMLVFVTDPDTGQGQMVPLDPETYEELKGLGQ